MSSCWQSKFYMYLSDTFAWTCLIEYRNCIWYFSLKFDLTTVDNNWAMNFNVQFKIFFMWFLSRYLYLYKINDMKSRFKYSNNTEDSIKNLKGGYTDDDFRVSDVYMIEKGLFVKTQLLDIFKDHHIVVWASPTTIG